jgi:hypothetical protein
MYNESTNGHKTIWLDWSSLWFAQQNIWQKKLIGCRHNHQKQICYQHGANKNSVITRVDTRPQLIKPTNTSTQRGTKI